MFWGSKNIVKLFSERSDMSMRRHLYSYWRTCCPTWWGPIAIFIALALCRRTEWLWWIRTTKLKNWYNGYKITLKKSCQIQEIPKRAHMLPFHSGLFTVRLSFLLMFLHKLTFLEVRKCDVLFAVTFYGLSQDQCWPLWFDNMKLNSKKMTTTRSNHFLTEKSNQLKSHSQLYSLFFKW